MSNQTVGRKWTRYSPEFKRAAVDRMTAGESPTVIARELGIRYKFLYAWKAAGKGSPSAPPPPVKVDDDPRDQQIVRLQRRVAELERLTGRQTAELDFFAAALRGVKATHRKGGASSDGESTK